MRDFQYFHESALVLSLAPENVIGDVLTTLSTGEAAIVTPGDGTNTRARDLWKSHDLEVWCGAWKSRNEVMTGGDDALLKLWDRREQLKVPSLISKWCVTHGIQLNSSTALMLV